MRLLKLLLRRFGIEFMSRRTWESYERQLALGQRLRSKELDVFSIIAEHEFRRDSLFFVQVGANDGVRNDPLLRLVRKHRWRGILVEPQPEAFQRLQGNFCDCPQLLFENVAIGKNRGYLTLYRFARSGIIASTVDNFTTFDREKLVQIKKRLGWTHSIEQLRVPVMPLQELLTSHGQQGCDVLVVDTEGMDCEVIRTLDFVQYRPAIIQFEHRHVSSNELMTCLEFLSEFGYRFVRVHRDIVAYCSRNHTAGDAVGFAPG
jgi:FkbM family methyltransferase